MLIRYLLTVLQLVMTPVDAMEFQKIEATREGKNYKSGNFEKYIIYEGAIYKALTFPGKTLDKKNMEETLGGH